MARSLFAMVWQRGGGVCEYCRMPQAFDELGFEVEHILSKKHGGQTVGQNLCLACFACNRHKGSDIAGKDPKTNSLVPLYHPRRMKWEKHFRWNGPRLVGLTPIGSVTIAVLGINLPHRIELRGELISEGMYPFTGKPIIFPRDCVKSRA
jgi:hypothetical protein